MAGEIDARYTYEFTHEFEEGPSGPARSYWLIKGPGASAMSPVCLHHRRDTNGPLTMQGLCIALDRAFEAGQADRSTEIRKLLNVPPTR